MSFNEWLVENGHAESESTIEFDLSAVEVDILYRIWEEEN